MALKAFLQWDSSPDQTRAQQLRSLWRRQGSVDIYNPKEEILILVYYLHSSYFRNFIKVFLMQKDITNT